MRVKCGHCKGVHESVAEVRSCASMDLKAPGSVQAIQDAERVAAFKAHRFGGEPSQFERSRVAVLQRPKSDARENAERRGPRQEFAKVADGRYAVEEDGTLKFFRVKNGNGRWAGYVFIDIQASDDLHAIRDHARKSSILALIAADEHGALVRYGRELGKCGRCGLTLTDEASRAAGIGPICINK